MITENQRKQNNWIRHLQTVDNRLKYVRMYEKYNKMFFGKWETMTTHTYCLPDYRTICNNEIVFDFDSKVWSVNIELCTKILEVIKKYDMPYYLFFSGGKGLHLHIFFEVSNTKMSSYDLRAEIFEKIIREAKISKKNIGVENEIDPCVIYFEREDNAKYFTKEKQGHLIALALGMKWYKGTIKVKGIKSQLFELPKEKPVILSREEAIIPNEIIKWNIPGVMLKEFKKRYNKKIKDKEKQVKEFEKTPIQNNTKFEHSGEYYNLLPAHLFVKEADIKTKLRNGFLTHHPIHKGISNTKEESKNTMIITSGKKAGMFYCFAHSNKKFHATGNGWHFLAMDMGLISCGESLQNKRVWNELFTEAVERGLIKTRERLSFGGNKNG